MSRRRKPGLAATLALTQRALADIGEIERYSVKEWGRKVAGKYLADIAAALDRIEENPQILRLEPAFAPGLYFYRVKKHVIVCDFHDEAVTVLTVIHTSMDLPARLLELERRLAAEVRILQDKRQRKSDQRD